MSEHTAQSSSQDSLTWASPWVGTNGLSSRTGWEIPLLEGKEESGTSKSRWLAKVLFMKECLYLHSASLRKMSASVELANPDSKAARELLAAYS